MMEGFDCVVAGAGVLGLAAARGGAEAGRSVLVVERAPTIGTGMSSRNSEVIHAGIYYLPGSLKAVLCVEGRHMLYEYCRARQVPHARLGKLIVAVEVDEVASLDRIKANAEANGVSDLSLLTRAQAIALEPQLTCSGAILSPSTGIIDGGALMRSLQQDAEEAG